jgi:hypothetical protein
MGDRRQETGGRLNPGLLLLKHTPIDCLSILRQQTTFLDHIASGGICARA